MKSDKLFAWLFLVEYITKVSSSTYFITETTLRIYIEKVKVYGDEI